MYYLALSALFECLFYESMTNINNLIISVRDRLRTSESDFYRPQILAYKDGPRTEWVNER